MLLNIHFYIGVRYKATRRGSFWMADQSENKILNPDLWLVIHSKIPWLVWPCTGHITVTNSLGNSFFYSFQVKLNTLDFFFMSSYYLHTIRISKLILLIFKNTLFRWGAIFNEIRCALSNGNMCSFGIWIAWEYKIYNMTH